MSDLGFKDNGDSVDILIVNGDIEVKENGSGDAVRVDERASIAQDIKHLIIESGILTDLIGERHHEKRLLYINRLKRLIDDDVRLIAGTVEITDNSVDSNNKQVLWVSAKTEKYSDIGFYL